MRWLIRDVVTHQDVVARQRCGCSSDGAAFRRLHGSWRLYGSSNTGGSRRLIDSLEMWLLIREVRAHQILGGSSEMFQLIRDLAAL
jgi:hypothetical protein